MTLVVFEAGEAVVLWVPASLAGFGLVLAWFWPVVWLCACSELGFGWVWLGLVGSGWEAVGLFWRWSVFSGAGWACCHRFHFFGGFYGICDTIGSEPVTDSIFFAVLMESATLGIQTSLV
ncbi:hypothetical protein CFREI_07905 [Corynebacterium freiburgense]|nr:hypothetical protein CFREI_07905 [Corynebacterium freiburgense]